MSQLIQMPGLWDKHVSDLMDEEIDASKTKVFLIYGLFNVFREFDQGQGAATELASKPPPSCRTWLRTCEVILPLEQLAGARRLVNRMRLPWRGSQPTCKGKCTRGQGWRSCYLCTGTVSPHTEKHVWTEFPVPLNWCAQGQSPLIQAGQLCSGCFKQSWMQEKVLMGEMCQGAYFYPKSLSQVFCW